MEEKKLSEYLKENNAYESFIENCLNNKNTLQKIRHLIELYYVRDVSTSGILHIFQNFLQF
jgi:hypothetical protein